MSSKTENLVICRAGDHSLHSQWLEPAKDRNFDLWINYFGTYPGRYAGDCDLYTESGGTKYPQLHQFIHANLGKVLSYKAIWLSDDDIMCDATTISKMFEVFQEYNLWLAQPSLTPNSFYSHQITLHIPNNMIRFTNFVEVMVPIFSSKALLTCLSTFQESASSWGLDFIWSKIMGNPVDKIGIIDAVSVYHTRPMGGGEIYQDLSVSKEADVYRLANNYGITLPFPIITYQSLRG